MIKSISPEDLIKLAEVKREPLETRYVVADWEVGQPRRVKWLIRDFLPAGRVTLLCGRGGIGKGLVVMRLVAEMTHGRDIVNSVHIQPKNVLWLTCEEDFEEDLLPLGIASGADRKRIRSLPQETEKVWNAAPPGKPRRND
jgi:RecA-family ATPase